MANGVSVRIARNGEFTATPAVSHAILRWNAGRSSGLADGIIITPSHNPPRDGGFKYNPPHGGPAETEVTAWIEKSANAYLDSGNRNVQLVHLRAAQRSSLVEEYDFTRAYVEDLPKVLDMKAIAASGLKLGVGPFGRGQPAALGTHCRDLWPGPDRGQQGGGPHLPFCALRQRRLNPHGLFLALCHESPAGDTRRL